MYLLIGLQTLHEKQSSSNIFSTFALATIKPNNQ